MQWDFDLTISVTTKIRIIIMRSGTLSLGEQRTLSTGVVQTPFGHDNNPYFCLGVVKLSFSCDNEVLVVKFVHMLINFFAVKLKFFCVLMKFLL